MKLRDITLAYCRRNNLDLYDGKLAENDAAPILPFLIMDCAYQEFNKEIKPIRMHHESKRARNLWLSAYKAFNHRLFSCLDSEQRDFTIEKMDEYAEYIANDIVRMKVAVMNVVEVCTFEDQMIIGSLMLCNIFSQVAQITWGLVYKTEKGQDSKCPELLMMRNGSHFLCNCIAEIPENIDPNQDKPLHDAVQAYMTRTTMWLNSQDKKQ